MAKRKQTGYVGTAALLLVLVCLILAIVGVCIVWLNGETLGASNGYKLSDLFDLFGESEGDVGAQFKTMASFAILTVILLAATTLLGGICKILGWKLFKLILFIAAVLAAICAVVTIITSYTFCDTFTADLFVLTITKFTPAVGMWLVGIGGVIGGLAGVAAVFKT